MTPPQKKEGKNKHNHEGINQRNNYADKQLDTMLPPPCFSASHHPEFNVKVYTVQIHDVRF